VAQFATPRVWLDGTRAIVSSRKTEGAVRRLRPQGMFRILL
jgi:hypothetical protein